MKNKLLVLCRDHAEFEEELHKLNLPDIEIHVPRTEDSILKVLPEVNIIFGNPPIAKHYVNKAPKLEWMQSSYAGVDALVSPDLRTDYRLTLVKDTYGPVLAEYLFAYILMFERELLENMERQKEKQWIQKEYATLDSKTLGILGAGSIGRVIANRAKGFEMRVLGFRTKADPLPDFDHMYDLDSIDSLLSESDYIVSTLPKTTKTNQLIDKNRLSQMKTTSVFINIGRGETVCEQDLIDALKTKQIKAAVLDVFQEEPLPEGHAFWSMPNVYVTPHISGYRDTGRFFEVFNDNYRRFIAGEELMYQVDFERGY